MTVMALGIFLYSGCGAVPKTLSDEEIADFNTEFFNGEAVKMNNMLLCSEYDTPEEINLFELFYNGVYNSMSGGWTAGDVPEEELVLLEEFDSYYLIHGDTNFDPCTVTSGTWESDDKLTLEYTKEYEGGRWVVILQKTDAGYRFVSNRRAD